MDAVNFRYLKTNKLRLIKINRDSAGESLLGKIYEIIKS